MSSMQVPRVGVLDMGHKPLTPQEVPYLWAHCGLLCQRWIFRQENISACPASFILWAVHLVSSSFFLEGIVPFVVEDLAVFLWDGEFRIFLCFLAWTNQFNSGQLLSHVGFFVTPRTAARQAFLSHHQLLELAQTHVHWVGDPIQPSHPLLIPSPPAFNLCQHQGL